MKLLEAGMSILRKTKCSVGTHVWTWTSSNGGDLAFDHPPYDRECDCGLLTWAEQQKESA